MNPLLPPLDYLSTETCRQQYLLSRMNRARNLAKEVGELLEQWVQEAALALLADWLRTYGIRRPASPRRAPVLPSHALPARVTATRENHRRPARPRRPAIGY
jgi:hypothetical protein